MRENEREKKFWKQKELVPSLERCDWLRYKTGAYQRTIRLVATFGRLASLFFMPGNLYACVIR